MARLIDADTVMMYLPFTQLYLNEYLKNVPTVEAIPKDQYETRLKADMVAMLTEIQLEFEEHKMTSGVTNQGTWNECIACCSQIVQQKINSLKAESENKE